MSGEIPRQPPAICSPSGARLASSGGRISRPPLVRGRLPGKWPHRTTWHLGKDLQSLACLVAQTILLSLLVRCAIKSADIACLVFVGNFLLVSAVVGIYSAQHPSHYGYASACLAGQLAFLAIWLILGEQPLGWRMLGMCAGGGLLICRLVWLRRPPQRCGLEPDLDERDTRRHGHRRVAPRRRLSDSIRWRIGK